MDSWEVNEPLVKASRLRAQLRRTATDYMFYLLESLLSTCILFHVLLQWKNKDVRLGDALDLHVSQ